MSAQHIVCVLLIAFFLNHSLSSQETTETRNLLTYRQVDGTVKKVQNLDEWNTKRSQILDAMQDVMGKLPDHADVPPMDIQIREAHEEETMTRYNIVFTVAENETLPAYLYVPRQNVEPFKLPAMLALHGTGAYGKRIVDGDSPLANRGYARELALRGYVVIAPDYPSFGDLGDYDFTTDRYESGTMKGIFNHIRCIDLLQQREDVDPERIGVIGHSLGGHNAMFVGAFDQRLKVIVSSCGWTELEFYDIGPVADEVYGGRLGPFAQERYMPHFREKYQLDGDRIPFNFHEIIATFAPRAFFSSSPLHDVNFDVAGVRKGWDLAAPIYRFMDCDEKLRVVYPDAEHDFPPEIRLEAYRYIDKILSHTPACENSLVR